MSTGVADNLLHAIAGVHRRWIEGSLSQEDALFEIGDRLEGLSLSDADASVALCEEPDVNLATIGDARARTRG
jgi:hypothetical protein